MQVFWGLEGLDEVLVRDAVFASCALPGYLPPREIRGRFYMDGATVDNLPVGTARILGSEVIIAVDVSASNALRADTQEEGFASVFARAAEIAMQTILELRLHEWTTPPIYYIHPRVEHISAFDFDHLREVVEEGYRATIAALDRPAEWPGPGEVGVHPRRPVTVRVQRERCIGCGACLVQAPPGMFVLDAQGKAVVTRPDQDWSPIDGEFIRHCPTYAISARPAAAPKAADAASYAPSSAQIRHQADPKPLGRRVDRHPGQHVRLGTRTPARGPDGRHQSVIVVQREEIGCRPQPLPMGRNVRDDHGRPAGDRLQRCEPETLEPAGADYDLGGAVGGHHVPIRET